MTLKTNSFEASGVTAGTTPLNGTNTGTSGDSLSILGTAPTYAATAAHGSLAANCVLSATGSSSVQWSLGGTTAGAVRAYIYLTDSPAASTYVMRVGAAASAFFARVIIGTDRKLFVQDGGSTTAWTATTALAINTWYRIELYVSQNTATGAPYNGTLKFDYYALDSTTPVETGLNNTTANTGPTNTLANAQFGKYNSTSWLSNFYVDDIAANDAATGYIGPVSTSINPPTVNAGSDVTQAISAGGVSLTCTATPASGGTITAYSWTQVSGPTCAISNGTSATCTVSPPASAGASVFRCTVTQTG